MPDGQRIVLTGAGDQEVLFAALILQGLFSPAYPYHSPAFHQVMLSSY